MSEDKTTDKELLQEVGKELWSCVNKLRPGLPKQAKCDLTDDAVAGDGFGENADHKTHHGDTTIQLLCAIESLSFDLRRGGVLIPAVARGRSGHHPDASKEILLRMASWVAPRAEQLSLDSDPLAGGREPKGCGLLPDPDIENRRAAPWGAALAMAWVQRLIQGRPGAMGPGVSGELLWGT